MKKGGSAISDFARPEFGELEDLTTSVMNARKTSERIKLQITDDD